MKKIFMNFLRHLALSFIISGALLTGCNPAKTLVAEGNRLAGESNYDEATSFYYSALLKKPAYKPAKDGLKISAQNVLNAKFSRFKNFVLENKIEEAVKEYRYAEQFSRNAERVGVSLEWPHEYDEVYEDVRREYTGILFDAAIGLIHLKKYDLAEKKIADLADIDSSYRSVSVLRMNTVLEPLYQDGNRLLEMRRYQDAYQVFSKIVNLDDEYKDAAKKKEEALSKATTRIGVLPSFIEQKPIGSQLDFAIADELQQGSHAFVKIVDYAVLKKTLESRGWSHIDNEEQAVQAGKNLGLQYVLFIKVSKINDTIIPKTIEKRTAFEAFTENIPNPYTDTYSYITKFKQIEYQDRYEAQYLEYNVSVSMISCNDSKVSFHDEFVARKADEVHKFDYNGNVSNLYQELPQANYLPPANKEWREQFTTSKRKLLDKTQLESELAKEIAKHIAFDFNKGLK